MALEGDSRALFERASRGDGTALDLLIERHLPGLEAYVRRHAGAAFAGQESAADVVQSVCREVLEHAERFRYDGEDGFKRWLYATALRKIQDRHRFWRAEKRDVGRRVRLEGGSAASSAAGLLDLLKGASSPSASAAERDEIARVERVLATLPERYQRVIQLAYLEQLPHAEVAARLEISEPNARMLLSRALARLARLLEE